MVLGRLPWWGSIHDVFPPDGLCILEDKSNEDT